MRHRTRAILSSMIGNTLELYDFALYGALASVIAVQFFPAHNPTAALLASFATFALGFLTRPFGAILFGHLGDRFGRRYALTLSITFMAIPTACIGLLPTYEKIGLVAPLALVACRLVQGLCAGGEYNGSAIFMIEYTQRKRAAFAGSLASVSGAGGALLALFVGSQVLHPSLPDWAWRVPFILGLFLGGVGLYMRLKVDETPEFQKKVISKKPLEWPLLAALRKHPLSILCCIGGGGFSGALSSTAVAYLPAYLVNEGGLSAHQSLLMNSFGILVFIVCCPFMGILADRIGREKVMVAGTLGIILAAVPLFKLAQTGSVSNLLFMMVVLHILSAAFIPVLNSFMNDLFPANLRYSGLAFGYGTGIALLGGTMPFFSTLLITVTGDPVAPALYLIGGGVVGLGVISLGKKLSHQSAFEQ